MLLERDFVEVETPTLTRSTPEGAGTSWCRCGCSPTLVRVAAVAATVQAVADGGGVGRYFQIARCYRDEDFRADRQPEFTQLDIEMSFVEQEDVIEVGRP